ATAAAGPRPGHPPPGSSSPRPAPRTPPPSGSSLTRGALPVDPSDRAPSQTSTPVRVPPTPPRVPPPSPLRQHQTTGPRRHATLTPAAPCSSNVWCVVTHIIPWRGAAPDLSRQTQPTSTNEDQHTLKSPWAVPLPDDAARTRLRVASASPL